MLTFTDHTVTRVSDLQVGQVLAQCFDTRAVVVDYKKEKGKVVFELVYNNQSHYFFTRFESEKTPWKIIAQYSSVEKALSSPEFLDANRQDIVKFVRYTNMRTGDVEFMIDDKEVPLKQGNVWWQFWREYDFLSYDRNGFDFNFRLNDWDKYYEELIISEKCKRTGLKGYDKTLDKWEQFVKDSKKEKADERTV